ncbi:MAG TPA: GGDEF domain-containing protein, partial [bacterium]|nr:GGDEF domain-containing protein [bacterium]
MSERTKWAGIYLLVCSIPFFFYFLPPLSPDVISHKAVINSIFLVPYAGLILIALLGWQINQTRIFWTALLLLAFYFYLRNPDIFVITETGRLETLQIVSVAFPVALCIIYLLKESRLWSDLSLARFLLALFPLLLLICLLSWVPDLYQSLMFWAPPVPSQSASLPKLSWVAVGFFLLVVTYLYDPKVKSFLVALMAAFVPFLFCIQVSLLSGASSKLPTSFHVVVAFTTLTLVLLHALLRMYWQKVYQDPLTAVSNRQALDERLHTLNGNFSLAMVDIDHFKKFNDTYGHAEGDNVLRMVAQHLEENLGDKVYRYGGEEFCVVFEKTTLDAAKTMMEKTRSTLEKRKF